MTRFSTSSLAMGLLAASLILGASVAQASVITDLGTTPPAPTGPDQTNESSGTIAASKNASNFIGETNAPVGEEFIPTASGTLTSITFTGFSGETSTSYIGTGIGGTTLITNIFSVSGSTFTGLDSETGTLPSTVTESDLYTVTLLNPIPLVAGTTYAFDLQDTAGGTSYYDVGTLLTGGSGNAFAASGNTDVPTSITLLPSEDRLFYVGETVVPEPASLGLLALGSVGLLTRRRRHA